MSKDGNADSSVNDRAQAMRARFNRTWTQDDWARYRVREFISNKLLEVPDREWQHNEDGSIVIFTPQLFLHFNKTNLDLEIPNRAFQENEKSGDQS
jgi:hypothetical protein